MLLTEWNTSDEVQPRLSEAPGGENGTARAARRTGDGAPHHCPESPSMAGSWSPSPTCCGKAASRPPAPRHRQTGGQVIPLGQQRPQVPYSGFRLSAVPPPLRARRDGGLCPPQVFLVPPAGRVASLA